MHDSSSNVPQSAQRYHVRIRAGSGLLSGVAGAAGVVSPLRERPVCRCASAPGAIHRKSAHRALLSLQAHSDSHSGRCRDRRSGPVWLFRASSRHSRPAGVRQGNAAAPARDHGQGETHPGAGPHQRERAGYARFRVSPPTAQPTCCFRSRTGPVRSSRSRWD